MINIKKDTTNTIVLELSSIMGASYSNFLFEFTPEWINESPSRYFTTPNTSPYINRYDEFVLTEDSLGATTQAVDNAPIQLTSGQYKYNVYASISNIDINDLSTLLATDAIQTGRMLVTGTDSFIHSVYQ